MSREYTEKLIGILEEYKNLTLSHDIVLTDDASISLNLLIGLILEHFELKEK